MLIWLNWMAIWLVSKMWGWLGGVLEYHQ